MEFRRSDMDAVHHCWAEESQDVEYIADATGLDAERVKEILQHLREKGKIKDDVVDENQVFSFMEMIDLDDYFNLDLHKIATPANDKDYFFDYEEVNEKFEEEPFEIWVRSKKFVHDFVLLDMMVKYEGDFFPIYLIYDRTEAVSFATPSGRSVLNRFWYAIEVDKDIFTRLTNEILDKIIPFDFWQTKLKFN
jgi:hypothetical protein